MQNSLDLSLGMLKKIYDALGFVAALCVCVCVCVCYGTVHFEPTDALEEWGNLDDGFPSIGSTLSPVDFT